MKDFAVRLAGTVIGISGANRHTRHMFRNYREREASPEVQITLTPELTLAERSRPELPDDAPDYYCEFLALHRLISEELIDRGAATFHASAVSVDGEAYLFAAVSGTGKSTHASLWRKVLPPLGHDVVMINDDKPFLRLIDGEVYACGSPWNGAYRLDSDVCVRVKAVCLLEQNRENSIRKINPIEAYPELYNQFYKSDNPDKLKKTLGILDALLKNASVYRLRCNMDDSAAELSYNTMKEK